MLQGAAAVVGTASYDIQPRSTQRSRSDVRSSLEGAVPGDPSRLEPCPGESSGCEVSHRQSVPVGFDGAPAKLEPHSRSRRATRRPPCSPWPWWLKPSAMDTFQGRGLSL